MVATRDWVYTFLRGSETQASVPLGISQRFVGRQVGRLDALRAVHNRAGTDSKSYPDVVLGAQMGRDILCNQG